MPAIAPPMLSALKGILYERFVPHLSPLLGNQNVESSDKKQLSRAFCAFVLQKLFDISTKDAADAVVDDFGDNGIDAIYYHEADETLYLLQAKLKFTEQVVQGDAESFTRGVRLLVEQELETFNQRIKDKAAYIENALDHCSNIKLIVAYVGSGVTHTAANVLNQLLNDQNLDEERIDGEILYIDSNRIEDYLLAEKSIRPVNTRIKLSHAGKIGTPRITVFGLAKVDDLVKLHFEYGKALYQKNIRYFIGAGRRGVNRAIKNSLESNPEDFFYLNNGITIVCSSIKPKKSKSKVKDYVVTGFSVVNGAQTISSAAQFKQDNPAADTDSAKVMVTIIHAPTDSGFHKTVTKARNLQNPVSLSDFAALDENQERLRKEMALHGVDYHYRPQHLPPNAGSVIDINMLAKSLACLHRDITFPGRLKAEPAIFTDTKSSAYKEIFTDELTGCKAINAVTVFKIIHELLQAADRSSPSPEKLVYRHCLYPLASVLMMRLKNKIENGELLTEANIRAVVSVPFDELRQQFADQYHVSGFGSMPHAFFKRIADTARLTQKVMIQHLALGEDEVVVQLEKKINVHDVYNQELTNYLISKMVQI